MIDIKKTALGIELGSTRIKAVLIDDSYKLVASGSHDWENRFDNGVWTYNLDDVWAGIQDAFRKLSANVLEICGSPLTTSGAIGISAMMHGYLPFDRSGKQLSPFRTWRNTMTEQAAKELSARFAFNIPQRWSIAHLYQAMLSNETHVKDIAFLTTLAGYVHWKLSGKKVLGIGDASGMFPIDSTINDYDKKMLTQFDSLCGGKYGWKLSDILPRVLTAGTEAGVLSDEGAALLDPGGTLKAGISLCPPEGDAGTGMVATNSVASRTGNVSAGTSIFAMVVLEKTLSNVHEEIDMVTTPTGKPVAMVHCNNCTGDLDAWVNVFGEVSGAVGAQLSKARLYDMLYAKALEGDADCGGLVSFNYYSGEPITGIAAGRPLFVRAPESRLSLANYMRSLLFSTMATLKIGMDILTKDEQVRLERLLGHGGLFKTKGVGQRLMAAALDVPLAVMESAGEGGAWGIALLAAFMQHNQQALETFLETAVFDKNAGVEAAPDRTDVAGFSLFMERYKQALAIEKAAIEHLNNITKT
ncbi:MAG: FGGY-family carbohydrate kinase [Spirochaetaceae bacterium]|jgi:sugar (pentulose or hexulose) kinase|nr:FGGY-family carbohydrate kinase [Spirochaetaceae bacterium]